MGTIYYLSATIFQQPVAEISHVIGRKPAFLLVLTFAAVGTIIAGTASSIPVLLTGRAFQGFASAGSVLSAIILTDLVPIEDRAIWLAIQNARVLFFMNLPLLVISAIGLACLLGFDRPELGIRKSLKRVDWIGIGIFIPSALSFLSPFVMAPTLFPWISVQALVPLVSGVIGLATLAMHQRFFAKRPMFRPEIFNKHVTVSAILGLTVCGICLNVLLFHLVLFWEGVRGYSKMETSVAVLPETVSIPIAALVCGLLMRRTNRIREAVWVGWPLAVLSLGLLWFMDDNTPMPWLVIINCGVGLAAGTLMAALNVALLAATKKELNGHAIAMGLQARSAGMCLGIAIGTTVFSYTMNQRLQKVGGGEMNSEEILRMIEEIKRDPNCREAIIDALRVLWGICCVLSGLVGLYNCVCKFPLLRLPSAEDSDTRTLVAKGQEKKSANSSPNLSRNCKV
ncbi:major facilitator superfamily domain-containing protein [Cercophora samala]|uniref:Major facilitator superfamily domain-containing protein n=1 Tax=Cercophora samala TaxID=330535 RepID=A0AA39ZAW0_9PEZI|nr:major facilitator superfamily domain-containing protein [Cercophora samala]